MLDCIAVQSIDSDAVNAALLLLLCFAVPCRVVLSLCHHHARVNTNRHGKYLSITGAVQYSKALHRVQKSIMHRTPVDDGRK